VEAGLLDPPQEADPRRRKAPAPRLPYRAFEGVRGTEIRVGRSARDNDTLSLKLCNGNDLWLHTADAPGSHVVLRTSVKARGKGRGREPEADPEELLDAAHLAVHFSPLQGAEKADVHVCACKQVHKPKGAKPGLVTLSGGRILQVRMQPERLERLLRADRRP
jgi:predicted ribosome quality control (RQC) complex YloA/Tae2 family protein